MHSTQCLDRRHAYRGVASRRIRSTWRPALVVALWAVHLCARPVGWGITECIAAEIPLNAWVGVQVGRQEPIGDSNLRIIHAYVQNSEWRDAVGMLPPSIVDPDRIDKALEHYRIALAVLSKRIDDQLAGASVAAVLAGTQSPDAEQAEEARSQARGLLALLSKSIWPAADRLIDETWTEIISDAEPEDPEDVDACERGRRYLGRVAYLRSHAGSVSWGRSGEGLDLRQLAAGVWDSFGRRGDQAGERAADVAEGALPRVPDQRGVALPNARGENVASPPKLPDAIEKTLSDYEVLVHAQIGLIASADRRFLLGMIDAGSDQAGMEQHRLARFRSLDSLRAAQRTSAIQVGALFRGERGVLLEAEWLDRFESVVASTVFPPEERPTRAFRWIMARVTDPIQRDEIGTVYEGYLEARRPLRTAAFEAVMKAKRGHPAPPRDGPLRRTLDEITLQRQALRDVTIAAMRTLLPDELAPEFDHLMQSLDRTSDAGRPWADV